MIETTIALITTCLPTLRTLLFGVTTPTGSSSIYPSNGRHYELSSTAKGGATSTNAAGGSSGTKSKSRTSTVHASTNKWPFSGDRGGSNTGKSLNDSDESLFRPVDVNRSAAHSKEIDPRTLGVLPDTESDRIEANKRKTPNNNKGGIMVTTAYEIQTESTLV